MSWLILLIYLAVLVLIAAVSSRKTRNLEDYYVGGRSLGGVLIGLSYYATFVSTNTFVGWSAKSYTYGVAWLITGVVFTLFACLAWAFLAKPFSALSARLGSVSVSDFFGLFYRSRLCGALAGLIVLVGSFFYLTAVLKGAAESASAMLGLGIVEAMLLVWAVQVAYTIVGGYRADVWSDAVQSGFMLLGAVLLPVSIVFAAGGPEAVLARISAENERLISGSEQRWSLLSIGASTPLLLILGISLSGGVKFIADPRQLSRFYGLREGAGVRTGFWVTLLAIGLTYLLMLPVGLLARGIDLPPEVVRDTDRIVPHLMGPQGVLSPWMGSLLLSAFLAAAMSSADSVLLVSAAALQKDILGWNARRQDPRKAVWQARLWVAVLSIPPAVVAVSGTGEIVELTALSGAFFAAAFLGPLLGALFWKGASTAGTLASFLLGTGTVLVWKFASDYLPGGLGSLHEVFPGILVGGLAFFLLSWLCPQPRK